MVRVWKKLCLSAINPLNICCPYAFPVEVVGEAVKISSKFIPSLIVVTILLYKAFEIWCWLKIGQQKLLLLFKEVRIFYSYLWLILSLRLQFGFQIQTKFCVGNMANLKLSCLFLLWTQDKNFLETNFHSYSSKWRSPWVDTSSGRKAQNFDVGKAQK